MVTGVFPVPTGMNRGGRMNTLLALCVPRAHGDEPLLTSIAFDSFYVFPVPTGMNRDGITRKH